MENSNNEALPTTTEQSATTTKNEHEHEGGHSSSRRDKPPYQASLFELYLMAMLVFGKCFTYWQTGFLMGYWEFFFAQCVVGICYLCFSSSIAEMTSILPFSGGSYGYVRCVLGPLIGYLIGFFEAMQYIMFMTTCLSYVGRILGRVFHTARVYQPLYWLCFYILAVPFQLLGGNLFWKASVLLGLWIILLALIYILGNAGDAHMTSSTITSHTPFHAGNEMRYLHYFPVGGWCFKGIEVMTLTCENIANPGQNVPRAIMASVSTMVVLILALILVVGSISPGVEIVMKKTFPLNLGLQNVFGVSDNWASLITLPTVIGTFFCFLYAGSHQLYAMASSGLFNPVMKETFGVNRVPYVAVLVVIVVSFTIQVILFYNMSDRYLDVLFTLSMMSSSPVYVCLCISYMIYSTKFGNLDRSYRSPFGMVGAVFALAVQLMNFISLIGFPSQTDVSSSLFCSALGLALIYYFLVAKKRQFFSKEEQKKFLKVYVVNANKDRHRRRQLPRAKKVNAIAPAPTMGVSSDDAETGKDGLIIVKQGWFDRIFGFFMRAQLDSDLMGSSSNQPVGESAHSNAIARSGSAAVTPMDVKEPELRLGALV